MADESCVWSEHQPFDLRGFFGFPCRGRGGGMRGRGCGRGGPRRDFMDLYAFDFDFECPESDKEDEGTGRPQGPHRHHHHRRGPPFCPRRFGMDAPPFFRPGHPYFGRKNKHQFTVDVYPFLARNTTVKVDEGQLVIETNANDRHQTVQKFKIPEHEEEKHWMVEQEDTETMVILLTRSKKQEENQEKSMET